MNSLKRSVTLARSCVRQYAAATEATPLKVLKEKQARFQCDDGLPVFLKGGAMDKVLYQTTLVLIVVGSGMMFKLFYDLSFPKK